MRFTAGASGAGLVINLSLLGGLLSPSAQAKTPVAFPDGEWKGQPVVWTGTVSAENVFATGSADVDFGLTAKDGQVVDGFMKYVATVASKVSGSEPVTIKGHLFGSFELGGTASLIQLSGSARADLTAKTQYGSFPVKFEAHGGGRFAPSFATCNKVTGDLSTEHEKMVQAQGVNVNLQAAFVAIRVAGAESTAIQKEYADLVDAITSGGDPAPGPLLALAERIDALNAKLAGLKGCQAPPKGFEKGLSDTLLAAVFQDLLLTIFGKPEKYSAQDLIALLGVGVRTGAVGVKVPGSQALKETANALFAHFEGTLNAKLDAANAAGDKVTILDILVAAQQYGMGPLADKAQGALAEVKP